MESVLDRPDPAAAASQAVAGPAATRPMPAADAAATGAGAAAAGVPWPLGAAVAGTTAVVVGLLWDISWHASIGRDTFWTPAHLAIYLGGMLCGLSAGWLALTTTFYGTAAQRAQAVGFWGFRAPLGAWVTTWGSIAMITSAPFDNWWHDAYGLDVKIISPPHLLLAAGILAIQLGAMLQAVAAQNRAGGGESGSGGGETAAAGAGTKLAWIYAYTGGLLLALVSTLFLEYNNPNRQHGARFYEICCAAYPLILVGAARGSRRRWAATTVAGIFMAVRLAMTWALPLFPATPKLAPIYNPVRHMWPLYFPELLIVPAVALDLLLRRAGRARGTIAPRMPAAAEALPPAPAPAPAGPHGPRPESRLATALVLGVAFFVLLLAVQWTFSELLLSPHGRNWFFAADQWTYRARPGAWRTRFWLTGDAFGPRAAALSLLFAVLSARLGLAWGDWLSRVRR
ncbi:MAG: hypothetical protein JOZ15_06050 [Acidobacteria bacterium]|nr:hypothetical protein [Acidobacteriota bacterium]